jgi:hypothetical protein
MFGLDALDLALSNIVAVVKSRTAAGFVPGWSSGTVKTQSQTQPPVTSRALAEVGGGQALRDCPVAGATIILRLCFRPLHSPSSLCALSCALCVVVV